MSTEILATEATLSTLKVEIKALVVSGKQMTLAVFRQLPRVEPIKGDQSLHGDISYWGTVRYSIKGEGSNWAVMERGGRLYRGVFYLQNRPLEHYLRNCYEDDSSRGMKLYYYIDNIESSIQCFPTESEFGSFNLNYLKSYIDKHPDLFPEKPNLPDNTPAYSTPEYETLNVSLKETRRSALLSLESKWDMAKAEYRSLAVTYAINHKASIEYLLSLPQLFIAV